MAKYNYFELAEFLKSDTADAQGIDNTPTFEVVENLDELVGTILDPLRAAWGGALKVTSGYRCEALNRAVGGVVTSVHKLGLAADIVPANKRIAAFVSFAAKWCAAQGIKWDQIIDEKGSGGSRWCHIGLRSNSGQQRCQVLSMTKK